ncbi:MAG: polyphenol oxidase family protein [Spirochaetales bacterium]|nr:polyphenol oxidase family protein [Spirochaetales bacterium]
MPHFHPFEVEAATGIDGRRVESRTIRAGVVLRRGVTGNPLGVSFRPAGAFSPREVLLTRREIAAALGRPLDDFRTLRQVHGATVVRRRRDEEPDRTAPEADAQFTTDPGLVLIANVADCCPVVVACDAPAMVGIAHSGWRGTVRGVAVALVRAMVEAGSPVEGLRAWLGPCADGDRYEVGLDVASRFARWGAAVVPNPGRHDRLLLDVGRVIAAQLAEAGIRRIAESVGGTISETRYHSHRRDGFAAGRMPAFVTMV